MFKHTIGDDALKVIKTFSYTEAKDSNNWHVNEQTTKKLLWIRDLMLNRFIDVCRSEEVTELQMKSLSEPVDSINQVVKEEASNPDAGWTAQKKKFRANSVAMIMPRREESALLGVNDEDLEEISVVRIQAMKDKAVFVKMLVQQKPVRFQVDCGASANILPYKHVENVDLAPCSQSLVTWNGTKVKPVGTCALPVVNLRNNTKYKENFVSVVENLKDDLVIKYADVFDEILGKLPGKVHLQVDPASQPVTLPARKLTVSVREKFKVALQRLQDLEVITPVDEPTEWVTQFVVAVKKSDARVFTKVDLASAFWHLVLDDESSLLTTFATPHGRYRWLRLPFVLCVSREIFQKHLHQELLGLPGVKCIAGDVLSYGKDDADHDRNLEGFMKRCHLKGIKLNRAKMDYRCKEVPFHGHILTTEASQHNDSESETINMIKYLPVSKERLQQIQRDIEADKSLQVLKTVIQKGWLEHKINVTGIISPYFNMRDEMSIQDDLIFKGERVVVPRASRSELLKRVHSSHLGVNGCLNRAREYVYWLG
ncbi:Enzymatic polyprotein [Stylophora pistillata]|uniref:Enzymatic polyprotein n=1 Tax=Stylophora pistillata TaxID=50429 RepID=A0A2B4SQZ9_STYPI|nr:Enzymatic polyprotein [Stylophora pistillata]